MNSNLPAKVEEKHIHNALGAYVRYLRKAQRPKEWGQKYLAQRAGVSQGVVSRIEDGSSVRLNTYIRLAHAFGITYVDLFRRAVKYSKRKEAK